MILRYFHTIKEGCTRDHAKVFLLHGAKWLLPGLKLQPIKALQIFCARKSDTMITERPSQLSCVHQWENAQSFGALLQYKTSEYSTLSAFYTARTVEIWILSVVIVQCDQEAAERMLPKIFRKYYNLKTLIALTKFIQPPAANVAKGWINVSCAI